MTKIRLSTVTMVVAFLVLALAMGAPAKNGGQGNNNNQGNQGNNNNQGNLTDQSVLGTYSFRLVPATSFAATAPSDPGGVATAPRQDLLRVGVFTADGAGNVAGHTLATTDTNTGATMLIDFTWTGTYNVNPDGTGTLIINDPPLGAQTCTDTTVASSPGPCATDEEGAETYAIVVNNHGPNKTIDLTQIDNVGGGAKIFMTGQARRQKGGDD